jgi:small GTP-binding protein
MGVGKTALSNTIISNFFDPQYQATVGVGYGIYRSYLSGHPVELALWDTAGMERYTSLGPLYYRGAHAALFVYDVADLQTALDIESWHRSVAGAVGGPFYGIVVANKIDLVQAADVREMEEWAKGHKFGFVQTSAKTGQNVVHLFEMAVQGAFLLKDSELFERARPRDESQRTCC